MWYASWSAYRSGAVYCAQRSKSESFCIFWWLEMSRTLLALVQRRKWEIPGNSNSVVCNDKGFSQDRKLHPSQYHLNWKAFLFIHSLNKICQGKVLPPQVPRPHSLMPQDMAHTEYFSPALFLLTGHFSSSWRGRLPCIALNQKFLVIPYLVGPWD